jgi:ribosomal protein S11
VREGATIVVLNGSGEVGLAQKKADELTAKNLNVIAVSNGTSSSSTVVIDKSEGKNSATKALLEKTYNVTASSEVAKFPDATNYNADFIIILGKNATSTSSDTSN